MSRALDNAPTIPGQVAGWLLEQGAVQLDDTPYDVPADQLLVCVVHNTTFHVPVVIEDLWDLNAFAHPMDNRPREWFLVPPPPR